MISISQTKIAIYLYDYARLICSITKDTDKSAFDVFKKNLEEEKRLQDINDEYYFRMLNIGYLFTKMKYFSIAEDYTLKQQNDFINNQNLDLSFLEGKIRGNTGSISNKKILQMIRDGFNHSTYGNELYKITPNCKYIEFSFKEPSPFTIKLSINDITDLTNAMAYASQTFQHFSFNKPTGTTIKEYVDNLDLTRHCFLKKIDFDTIEAFLNSEANGTFENALNEIITNNKVATKQIKLSQVQANSILNNIEIAVKNNIITLDEFKENLKELTLSFISKELPIPVLKFNNYIMDSIFIENLLKEKIYNYIQMYKILDNILLTFNPTNKYETLLDKQKYYDFKLHFSDADENLTYASLLFVEYVLSNFKTDDAFIKIGKKNVEYRKLRNSLAHARWHLQKDKVVFYDAAPSVKSEMNYNWSVKLNLIDLNKYCIGLLQHKIELEKQKNNPNIKVLRKQVNK